MFYQEKLYVRSAALGYRMCILKITLTVHKYDGLLLDRKGIQAASAQRKQIGALIHVAEIGDKI